MKKLLLIFAAMLATVGVKAEVTLTPGENSQACTVNDIPGVKCGTSSKNGSVQITVPANTKSITLDAGAWGSNTVTLSVTGSDALQTTTLDVKGAGFSGNPPFTITATSETTAQTIEFSTAVATETTITLAPTTTMRFVVWNVVDVPDGEGTGVVKPARPTISGATEFVESTEVTITAAEGCKIYYSYDEGDFEDLSDCTEYTATITLTETSTIYAQAVDAEGKTSDIASKTFTKLELTQVNSIAAIADIEKGTKVQLNCALTAIYQNGSNLVVTDGTSSILVYGSTGKTYKNGDVIAAGSIVTVSEYGGNKQLTPNTLAEATEGTPVVPTLVTATTLAEQGYLAYVKMENVSLAINNKNITITDAEGNEVAGYNQFNLNLATLDTDAKFNIIGVYGSYNGNKQLQPTDIISLAPAYEPEGEGTLEIPYTVKDIKHLCATADAPEEKVWVKGTIAGNVNSNTGALEVPEDTENAAATNLMLKTGNDMISVQLLAGDVRAALNIKDNFENIGKEVWVYGTIKEIYCKIAGVKNVTDFSWDGTTTDIRSINTNNQREGKFLQNGKVVIVKYGKTYNTDGKLMIND